MDWKRLSYPLICSVVEGPPNKTSGGQEAMSDNKADYQTPFAL